MVSALSPKAASGTAGIVPAGDTSKTIAGNFETFLNLLTTQLKNQSPLDPLDTNQFTQQLVQFASVEQQMKSNESLTALLSATKTNAVVNAAALVGTRVTAEGATTRLADGNAEWRLQAERAVSAATVTITDSTGSVVHTEKRNLAAGDQLFSWNGRTSTGTAAPHGEYTVNVTALDSSGGTVPVRTELSGSVEKVDLTGTEPTISVGKIIIPLSKVKAVQRT